MALSEAQTRGGVFTLLGHTGGLSSVSFSPDGTRIVTGSQDRTAKVWDAADGDGTPRSQGATGPVRSVSFSPDGTRIVTGSRGTAGVRREVWDAGDAGSARSLELQRGHDRRRPRLR